MLRLGVSRSGHACCKPSESVLEVLDLLHLVGVFETSAEESIFFVRERHYV